MFPIVEMWYSKDRFDIYFSPQLWLIILEQFHDKTNEIAYIHLKKTRNSMSSLTNKEGRNIWRSRYSLCPQYYSLLHTVIVFRSSFVPNDAQRKMIVYTTFPLFAVKMDRVLKVEYSCQETIKFSETAGFLDEVIGKKQRLISSTKGCLDHIFGRKCLHSSFQKWNNGC